jgi:hypothetical protein
VIFEAKSFTKIFDYGGQNGPLVITPQNIIQPPHREGLGGSGAPLISPPNSHFIGGPESVKILGV